MSRLSSIVIFCRDPYVAGPFWSLALGIPPVPGDAQALADRSLDEGESVLLRDPQGRHPDVWVSPTTDEGRGLGMIHLDLRLDAVSELQALIDAGARVAWEVHEPHRWTVLEAPDGVLFCAIHPKE